MVRNPRNPRKRVYLLERVILKSLETFNASLSILVLVLRSQVHCPCAVVLACHCNCPLLAWKNAANCLLWATYSRHTCSLPIKMQEITQMSSSCWKLCLFFFFFTSSIASWLRGSHAVFGFSHLNLTAACWDWKFIPNLGTISPRGPLSTVQ